MDPDLQRNRIDGDISKHLAICEEKIINLETAEAKVMSLYNESINNIKVKEHELQDIISTYARKLQDEIEEEKQKTQADYQKEKAKLMEAKTILKNSQNSVQSAIDSNQVNDILAVANDMETTHLNLYVSSTGEMKKFVQKETVKESVHVFFGSIAVVCLGNDYTNSNNAKSCIKETHVRSNAVKQLTPNDKVMFEIERSFTTDWPKVSRIVKSTENMWISNYQNDLLRKIKTENGIEILKEISSKILDFALTADNRLLLSVSFNSDIQRVNTAGELKPFLSVSPYLTNGIHVTKNDEIIVGVRERDGHSTCRKIIIFGKDLKQKNSFEHDKFKIRLFTIPFRITTNGNKDIFVVDYTTSETGRVVAINKEGILKWIYEPENENSIGGRKPFFPQDIVTTTSGKVIVVDFNNSVFHVLSENGDVLAVEGGDNLGIEYPVALDIDNMGHLWVGCGAGDKEITGAKIHVLKCLY